MAIAIVIEFGGQSIKVALVDSRGKIRSRGRVKLDQVDPAPLDSILEELRLLIQVTKKKIVPTTVGIAHPNPFDSKTLTFHLSQKPAYRYINGHPLRSFIAENTDLSECHTIYDGGAAGVGELWQGKMRKSGRFLLLTLGTGLGAVFAENGLLVTGIHVKGIPESGELWDYRYMNANLEDATGSTKAAVSIYQEMGGFDSDILAGDIRKLALLAIDGQDSVLARRTFEEFGRRLGESLAPIVEAFCPEAIILSGSIAKAHALFIPMAQEALEKNLSSKKSASQFAPSDLIDEGGLLGAAFRAIYPKQRIWR